MFSLNDRPFMNIPAAIFIYAITANAFLAGGMKNFVLARIGASVGRFGFTNTKVTKKSEVLFHVVGGKKSIELLLRKIKRN